MDKQTRILVITEEPLSKTSLGFGKTLTNILQLFPTSTLLFYVPKNDYDKDGYREFAYPVVKFRYKQLICLQRRRYAIILNRLLDFINNSFQYLAIYKKVNSKIKDFDPDIILLVPMRYSTLLEGYVVHKKINKPIVVYLMDDTFHDKGYHIGGYRQKIIYDLLLKANGWIMISRYLSEELSNRYNIQKNEVLILHNPVDTTNSIKDFLPLEREKFIIAYAGSIHPFHADALLNIARAVYELRQEGIDIVLQIYTRQDFWQHYDYYFRSFQVVNGGFIVYENLFDTLNNADILLCTTSFDKQYFNLVSTSVFTKISDYMASGRPVLSYGPSYSANNRYLIENEVGLVFESNDIADLKSYLLKIRDEKYLQNQIIIKQFVFLKSVSDSNVVYNKLTNFLKLTTQKSYD